jgi:hypothetical protein
MSIELFWDDEEQTVMLVEFNGQWTWEELQKVLAASRRLSEERGRILGAIIDVRNRSFVPGGTIFSREALKQFGQIREMASGGRGPVVILGMNGLIKTILDTVKSLDKNTAKDVHFADTMPEAQQIIYDLMRQLPDAAP